MLWFVFTRFTFFPHHVEHSSHLVDDKGGQGLSDNVLGHDEEGLLGLHHGLQQRDEVVHLVHLFVGHQDLQAEGAKAADGRMADVIGFLSLLTQKRRKKSTSQLIYQSICVSH